MANAIYDKARESFLLGQFNLSTDNIKAILVDSASYTPNMSTHQFLSDITAGIVATSANLASKTTTAGVFDAADVTFTAVSGASAEYIILYQDTGTSTTSRLICLIDTATGLPVTPGGGDITITWDNGSNRVMKL